jgi:hypothetical protein
MDDHPVADLPFDFITDEALRTALREDYKEMVRCAEANAWKAVHVLAGSLIEAVLVDYLVGTAKQKKPDPLSMGMGDLITACKKAGILSKKSADLSSALKEYRNLIHPGRAKRLGEQADREGALVAESLVRLIVGEVAAKQASERGLTAEQISRKFATDPSALNIAEHLLKDAEEREIERLLVDVVPDAYFNELEDPFTDQSSLERQAKLFRTAFEAAPDSVKSKVMRQHVKILKEATGGRVEIYELHFFQAPYLKWVDESNRQLVREHLLSQLEDADDIAIYEAAKGIGGFLEESDINLFVDALVRQSIRAKGTKTGIAARRLLEGESSFTSGDITSAIINRIDAWIIAYENRGDEGQSQIELLKEVKADYEIPF